MSLEQALADNTAAIKALTEALFTRMAMTEALFARMGGATAGNVETPAPEKGKGEKGAGKPAAQKAPPAATQTTAAAAAAPEKKDDASAPALVYETVAGKIRQVAREKGREATIAMLAKFGVTNGQELKPEQWADCIAAADKVLAS